MESKRFEKEIAGKKLIIETGVLAEQSNGSCLLQYGDTVVLATAVMAEFPRDGIGYFPLLVDYEEKLYAAGKIKGSRFVKREGRPTDEAILTSRMVDRGIRPLFDRDMRNDVQVILTVLSVDGENDPDILSIIGASAALQISDIPWDGPLAGLRVCVIDNEFKFNPSYEERAKAQLDLTLTGTKEKILMIEAAGHEADKKFVKEGIKQGKKILGEVVDFINQIQKEVGKEKIVLKKAEIDGVTFEEKETYIKEAKEYLFSKLEKSIYDTDLSKRKRNEIIAGLKKEIKENFLKKGLDEKIFGLISADFDLWVEEYISKMIMEKDLRVDFRKLNEVRKITIKPSLLPRTHGSVLFQRGETQVLSIVTLGAPGDELVLDTMEESGKRRYMHHYNFPPFSTGEVGPLRGPGRREIGHGALAEKAIFPVLPKTEDFPYTIRVVSEVLGSNGSSSMGSTCGSTVALMDAGVPIANPVAGIAIGLVSDESGKFKIVTDIRDLEDGPGGMDFKVTATKNGITAIQMDTKTTGLSDEIIENALDAAENAINFILGEIAKVLPAPRPELSKYAPRIITTQIDPEKIREVIGTGGKVINEIIAQTGVQIDIEDSGLVMITSPDLEKANQALDIIHEIVNGPQIGKIYKGKVTRLLDFGALVQLNAYHDGMVHVSQIAERRINKPSDVLKVGQEVEVKVKEIDDMGRTNLTMLLNSTKPSEDSGFKKKFFKRDR